MNRKANRVAFSATLVVVAVAFLSTLFFVDANLSFAAAGKKKSPAVARPSAVEHTEVQIKQLQDVLNITEAQKELWDNLAKVMRENATDMDALRDARYKERAEGAKTLNAVEHMKLHSQITKAQLDQMEKLIPPFEAFYSSMSDQQKNITNSVFNTGKYGRHGKQKRK
jgi:hypothetical protein